MYWLIKIAGAAEWLAGQGVAPEFVEFALEGRIPRKMQKWLAVQLNKLYKAHLKSMKAIDSIPANIEDFIANHRRETIEIADMYEWKTEHREPLKKRDINQYSFEEALEESNLWQQEMEDRRGEGHPEFYQFPRGHRPQLAEDMGNGFYITEVPLEDLPNEGAIMQHCVGDGGYDDEVQSGQTIIYSLRDAKGWPHATIEVTNRAFVSEEDAEEARREWEENEENWIRDDDGDVVDIDWDGYDGPWEGDEDWNIEQIQGKQNESPVDKYRPYLRKWVDNHDYQISESDALALTPQDELIQRLVSDSPNSDLPDKIMQHLDPEGLNYVFSLIESNPKVWSPKALIWYLDHIRSMDDDEEKIAKYQEFLSDNWPDTVRSRAAHNMHIPMLSRVRRNPELKEWAIRFLEQEQSPDVAKNIYTTLIQTARNPLDDKKKGPIVYYVPEDVVPVATQLAERFIEDPSARNLYTILSGTLAREVEPELGAKIIEKSYMFNAPVSTYELRSNLGMMPTRQFWEIWSRLSDNAKNRLSSDDWRGNGYDLLAPHEAMLSATHEYNNAWRRRQRDAREIAKARERGETYEPPNPEPWPEWPEYNPEWEANQTENQLLSRPGIHWEDKNQMYFSGMDPRIRPTAQQKGQKFPDEHLVRLYSMHIGRDIHSLNNFIGSYHLDIDTYNLTGRTDFLEKAETKEREMRKFLYQKGITAKRNWLTKIC